VALGRNAEALAAYEDAIVLVPGEFGPHHNRGILLAQMGELDDALAELDRAEGLDPDWAGEGSAWAGAISWHQRDSAGARDRFARVQNRVGGCTIRSAAARHRSFTRHRGQRYLIAEASSLNVSGGIHVVIN
jgi:tetratricopeptide (TPR) repeat protein